MNRKYMLAVILMILISCNQKKDGIESKLRVVTTTTLLTDLVYQITKDSVILQGLMGVGVDPHLYKASEGDVTKLFSADLVFYGGLHLEGKLVDVFEKMNQQGKATFAVSDALEAHTLIGSEYFASSYDPHIWFDVSNWQKIARYTAEKLIEADAKNAAFYRQNLTNYLTALDSLEFEIRKKIETLAPEKRILVTAHDAFNYFGKAYDFQVVGLQGLSTATEASVQDVQQLTDFIIANKIKAIFVESSVPRRTIEALQESVSAKGHQVRIGGSLYSDALGSPNTPEGTYTGMFLYNVETIVNALK
ncbi:MAG: zinc ABC transporter substrate-binding protein [Flavobacteriaceae bacterium]|nr:zinc ABC transporter substrate-binding protein [Flavobacteriaceae bacterium]